MLDPISYLVVSFFDKIIQSNSVIKIQQSLHTNKSNQVSDQKILDQVRKDLIKITDMHRKKKELADNMGSLLDRFVYYCNTVKRVPTSLNFC